MVGFYETICSDLSKLKALINERKLGKVRSFQMKFAVDSTPFCENEEQFMKLAAIHMVDLMRYLFGEATQVTGTTVRDGKHINQSISFIFDQGLQVVPILRVWAHGRVKAKACWLL